MYRQLAISRYWLEINTIVSYGANNIVDMHKSA